MKVAKTFAVMVAACSVIAAGAFMIGWSAMFWPKFWGVCMVALGVVNIALEAREWLER